MKLLGLVLAAVLVGCVPVASSQGTTQTSWSSGYASTGYGSTYASSGTGVYINDQEISAAEKAQLEDLLQAVVPPGRYYVDAQGNAAVEGSSEPVQMYSTDSAGRGSSLISDGDCIMVSTPDMSMDSGC